ncbi:hypothetical protein PENTCL1PPCAC_19651, partial [Pristionchus entomophagus]
ASTVACRGWGGGKISLIFDLLSLSIRRSACLPSHARCRLCRMALEDSVQGASGDGVDLVLDAGRGEHSGIPTVLASDERGQLGVAHVEDSDGLPRGARLTLRPLYAHPEVSIVVDGHVAQMVISPTGLGTLLARRRCGVSGLLGFGAGLFR